MPENKTGKELADNFANYFLEKIQNIRENLNDKDLYIPSHKDVPTLKYFKPVESDHVKTMIMSMQSKSCELDQIPTAVLKEILD